LAKLKSLSCQYGQGYLFSKPLPHREAEALIPEAAWPRLALLPEVV
jgi:EAL domain-containing protein (putative c-di-GMP-specific phosphodiesterase class I)